MQLNPKFQRAFTLVEMIVVMAITGILGGMIAMLIKGPVQGYVDSARRAELAGIADVAMSRLASEFRIAVPNSVRSPDLHYIEFLPAKAVGRYRAAQDCSASCVGDMLDFTIADASFDILGPPLTFAANDWIVVGSAQPDGNPPYDISASGVLRAYTGASGVQSNVLMTAVQFPAFADLPSRRFDLVSGDQQAVTYACEQVGVANGDGTGTLGRYWGYGFNASQVLPSGPPHAVLADKISRCKIAYDAARRLVTILLGITRSNESISLYQEIHVSAAPSRKRLSMDSLKHGGSCSVVSA